MIAIDGGPAAAGAKQVTSALKELRNQIAKDTAALQELQAAAGRLKGSAEVVRFEALGKDLAKAQTEADKIQGKLGGLKGDALASAQNALADVQARAGRLGAEREKLSQTEAVKAYQDVHAAIRGKQAALAKAQAEVTRLGGSLKDSVGPATGLGDAIGQIPGPLGGLAGQLEKVAAFVGPIGVLVAAFVMLTSSAISGAIAMGKFALAASDAARSAAILREAAAGSAEGGKALDASIERVYGRTAAAREQIEGLALELRRAGLAGAALEGALSSVTTTTQVMGDQAGAILKGLADRAVVAKRFVLQPLELRGTGLAIKDVAGALAKEMKIGVGAAQQAFQNGQVKIEAGLKALDAAVQLRFGALAQKQMIALPVQLRRAGENLRDLFKNVDPTKILEGLSLVLGLLDKSTATGKALRVIVDGIFGPMGAEASRIFPMIRTFLIGIAVVALDTAITFVKLRNSLRDMLGTDALKGVDGMRIAFELGGFAARALVAILASVAALIALVGASVYILLVQPIQSAISVLSGIGDTINAAVAAFDPKKFSAAGANLVKGIIEGVRSQAPLLFDTIASLATGGLTAFATAAQIQSPSKAFAEKARFIPLGVEQGVEQEAPRASKAIAALGSPAQFNPQAASAGAGGGRGSVTIHAPITIQGGASLPSDAEKQRVYEYFVEIIGDACRQLGLTPAEATA